MDANAKLVERLALAEKIITETPIVRLEDDRLELYTKLEYLNGIGSIKDRPAFWILKRAIERHDICPGTTVIESSSGNFACALATFCSILALDFIAVIDPNISPLYEAYLRVQCKRVVKVDERDDTGGFLKTRLRITRALLDQVPQSYWPNQYENRDGMAAHYRFTGTEICRALPRLDCVFLGVGSGGTLAGVSRRLKEHDASIRIVAVDPEGSMIFGKTPRPRHIPGIGSSISPALVREALIDDIAIVPERDAVAACHLLLQRHGLFVGGSSGAVYAAIQTYFRRNPPAMSRPRVLFLCMDRGTAYVQTVFNPDWVASRLGEPVPTT